MKLDQHTILHRKDESGVIVESGVFGPDDEIPEGFGPQEFEVVKNEPRVATIAESKLTPTESEDEESEDEVNEVNEGSPVQAKVEAGADLTESEENPGEEKAGNRRRRSGS